MSDPRPKNIQILLPNGNPQGLCSAEKFLSELLIDNDQFEVFMEHEQQKGGVSPVSREAYRWFSN